MTNRFCALVNDNTVVVMINPGLSIGMSFLWESHGKHPMGFDGTAHICMSHDSEIE